MEKLSNVGGALFFIGCASYLLSLFNLQFKGLDFLGDKKSFVEFACIAIGLVIMVVVRVMNKGNDTVKIENENKNENENEQQNVN